MSLWENIYRCEPYNTFLLISAPTGPPSDVRCTNRSSHSLTFTWQTPECGNRNGPIKNYSYTLLGPINKQTRNGSTPASENYTEVILDYLIPSSTYVFSVKAMNNDLSGVYKEIEANTTRAGKSLQCISKKRGGVIFF